MNLREATAHEPLGGGRFAVELRPEFAIGGDKPNGGYLLATLARAAIAAAGAEGATQPHPVAVGVQYAVSPNLGPAEVETTIVRVGRTASQVEARVVQDGTPTVAARFTLGTLHDDSAPHWGAIPPVAIPPIDECVGFGGPPGRPANGSELRFDPATTLQITEAGLSGATGEGELRAWFRFTDGEDLEPWSLLYVADAMPPATFTVLSTGWVPTLDLSVYVRAVPAPGAVRIRFRVQVIQDGFADEVCEIWDSAGRLVVQSTQLTALRMPSA